MLPIEHIDLEHVENIITLHDINIDLYRHKTGILALTIPLEAPPGISCFAIEPTVLKWFVTNRITLQELFEYSPSLFIEIREQDATRLYMRFDIDIRLKYGDLFFGELQARQQNTNNTLS